MLSLNPMADVKLFIYKRCLVTRQRYVKTNPVDNQTVWSGGEATMLRKLVKLHVQHFLHGHACWARSDCRKVCKAAWRKHLAEVISQETSKPFWETLFNLWLAKLRFRFVLITSGKLNWNGRWCGIFTPPSTLAVFGPYNFPGHLPNGHMHYLRATQWYLNQVN